MEVEAERVERSVKEWLEKGFWAPDDLMARAREQGLRPAYIPVWVFDCELTVHWEGRVGTPHGRHTDYEQRQDQHTFTYKNHLLPGVRSLPIKLFRDIEPFNLSKLVDPKPEYLAGWPAATYDLSLADATVAARGEMSQAADKQMLIMAVPGKMLLNFQISGHDFMEETYRLALLPVWLSTYTYAGKLFQVLINGQTGKVAGDKPIDRVKVAGLVAAGFFALVVLIVVGTLLTRGGP